MLATAMKAFLCAFLLLITACAREPAVLVDGLVEGMSESEALAVLRAQRPMYRVLYENSLPPGDQRPPYSEKTISLQSSKCADVNSEVWLAFYLGQLREVTCYPTESEPLMGALRKRGIAVDSATEFQVDHQGVQIHGSAVGGRWGVSFTSRRLASEQDAWINKYS